MGERIYVYRTCARKDTHKYSEEQRKIAVEYYLNNGMSIKKTVTALGYPGKALLGEWINEDVPREKIRYRCKRNETVVRYSKEQKIEAVSKYCGGASPTKISKEYGIAPGTVYVWKKSFFRFLIVRAAKYPETSINPGICTAQIKLVSTPPSSETEYCST